MILGESLRDWRYVFAPKVEQKEQTNEEKKLYLDISEQKHLIGNASFYSRIYG